MAKDMEGYTAKVIENMEKQSGKKFAEFVEILKATGLTKHKEQVEWLKANHGLGNTQAQLVAWEANKPADYVPPTDEDILASMYKGKEHLKPIYEKVLEVANEIGDGWKLNFCQGYVAFERDRQFLVVQPSTKTRVDVGFALPDMEPAGRLLPAKNVGGGRITHAVAVTSPDQVDAELADWIRMAYAAAPKK